MWEIVMERDVRENMMAKSFGPKTFYSACVFASIMSQQVMETLALAKYVIEIAWLLILKEDSGGRMLLGEI